MHWKIHLNACLLPCEISHIVSSARSSLNNLISTSIHLQSHLLLACIFFCENLKLFFPSSEQSEADLYVLEERRCLLLMIVVYGRFTLTLCVLYLFKWNNRKDHYCWKKKRTTSMESFMGIVEEAITWGHGNMIVLWFSMHQLDYYCLWKWWMSEDIIE